MSYKSPSHFFAANEEDCLKDKKQNAVVILGAKGQLGSYLTMLFPTLISYHAANCFALDRHTGGDITNYTALEKSFRAIAKNHKLVVVINCAAYTAVDLAEKEPEKAYTTNVKGVDHIAQLTERFGWGLIHISSDYVFDGKSKSPYREEDPLSPLSIYGQTKIEGEKKLSSLQALGQALIVRSAWIFSARGNNFLKKIFLQLSEGKKLYVVNDQIGSPTYAMDLAIALLKICNCYFDEGAFRTSLLHYTNTGQASWYDIACEIAKKRKKNYSIEAVTSDYFNFAARRPAFSVLDISKAAAIYQLTPPSWQEAVRRAIAVLQEESIFHQ